MRDKLGEQARTQNGRLIDTIRETAGHLDDMRADRQDSPAAAVVSRVADGGRQLADYLDRNGPEGVLQEVQDFARRRPGAFLATALAAGFVVGRLGKSVVKAEPTEETPTSRADFVAPIPASAGYARTEAEYTGTEYSSSVPSFPVTAADADPYGYPTLGSRP